MTVAAIMRLRIPEVRLEYAGVYRDHFKTIALICFRLYEGNLKPEQFDLTAHGGKIARLYRADIDNKNYFPDYHACKLSFI